MRTAQEIAEALYDTVSLFTKRQMTNDTFTALNTKLWSEAKVIEAEKEVERLFEVLIEQQYQTSCRNLRSHFMRRAAEGFTQLNEEEVKTAKHNAASISLVSLINWIEVNQSVIDADRFKSEFERLAHEDVTKILNEELTLRTRVDSAARLEELLFFSEQMLEYIEFSLAYTKIMNEKELAAALVEVQNISQVSKEHHLGSKMSKRVDLKKIRQLLKRLKSRE